MLGGAAGRRFNVHVSGSLRIGHHRLSDYRVVAGNHVSLLVDGAQAFPAMLRAIERAQRTIVLDSYIYAADRTGQRFLDQLVAAAHRGVKVRVLVDGVGSLATPNDFFAPLRQAGGEALFFRPPAPWRPKWGFWQRDHRKMLIVDDEVGFTGGINIADEYAPVEQGGGAWHDVHAQLDGPAVREMTKIFNRTWYKLTQVNWDHRLRRAMPAGNVPVQVLESALTKRRTIRAGYLQAIRDARRTIRITNAYFIPDQGVRRALANACWRGVRVQLLLAGRTDMRPVLFASRALYARLLRWGVEVYEWTDRVLHAKSAVIDGVWCSIGSYNLDRRSLLHNLEANIVCLDPELGRALDEQFERDVARSQRIDVVSWHRRPILDKLIQALFFKLRWFL